MVSGQWSAFSGQVSAFSVQLTTPPYGHPSQEGNTAAAENVRLCERSEAIQRNGVPLAMYKLQITLYKEVLVALF